MILQKILEKLKRMILPKKLRKIEENHLQKSFSEIFKKWKTILQKIFWEISGCVNCEQMGLA